MKCLIHAPLLLFPVALLGAAGPRLLVSPIEGLRVSDLHDSFRERHSTAHHRAIDLMAPRGTPVRAVVDGIIEKLTTNSAGGITIYQYDKKKVYCYYYAHLNAYVEDLQEGMRVVRGEIIAYVGSTGNASPDAPHLHFAVSRLGSRKRYWKGRPINPYPLLVRLLRGSGLAQAAPALHTQ